VLNLDKPGGMTSRDVVDRVTRPLRGVKVGHAGTLDPLATGVLVVCVGSATRLIEYVQRSGKSYRTVVRLGARSDTLDADGQIEVEPDPLIPTEAELRSALSRQVGTIDQIPPQYSALKVAGRRAYDLARAGQAVALEARPVVIERIELVRYEWPRVEFTVDCGSGTYIRSIARDLGEALGCGGLVEVLVRTRIGRFLQSEAIDPLTLTVETIEANLRPPLEALDGVPRIVLDADQVALVLQGKGLDPTRVENGAGLAGEVALLGPDFGLVAIAEATPGGAIQPRKVLAGPA
jgi:tRNA pseudouridine55 synthase